MRGAAAPVELGRVARIAGLLIEASVPDVSVGDVVEILRPNGADSVHGEVVGFRDQVSQIIPIGEVRGLRPGALVRRECRAGVPVGDALLGRVVDAFGRPLDDLGPLRCAATAPLDRPAPPVRDRARVTRRFDTGVRVIDALLTCGRGQRIGIFAGAGVGKSTLVEQIALHSDADVIVFGLIGERGREVRELMAAIPDRPIVAVAATSDKSPLERARGAQAATAIAEHFRDRGANVLLLLDSLTRYAMALREIGLSAGEPPATKGYPPSVFAELPRLLERVSPMAAGGSITAFYSVLVEGDDLADPIADSARSLLDAHIVLSRELAARGQFPAVDVLASASRVAHQVTSRDAQDLAAEARRTLAVRREADELRSLGAYVPGSNPTYDAAVASGERIDRWARQRVDEHSTFDDAMAGLRAAITGQETTA
ncbi:MAG: FliI/YscN family ATPase [Deltaproteobacteria bacterium]|nr:MAG: FliI/YscN family ATPase [Deltaproteobacteria bacterium]